MRNVRGIAAWAALLMVLLSLTSGCGGSRVRESSHWPTTKRFVGSRSLVWARGDVIHVGNHRYDAGVPVRALVVSPYGFFINSGIEPLSGYHPAFVAGDTRTPLPSTASTLMVSPNGRYVAWIDYAGPRSPAGRLAKLVVSDVRSGAVLHQSTRGMNDPGGDVSELYDEHRPAVLGFDGDQVYWWNTRTTLRIDVRTGRITPGERNGRVIGSPHTAVARDYEAAISSRGRPVAEGSPGFRSVDKRWAFMEGDANGTLIVIDEHGHRVHPDYGHRYQWFGGWLGRDRIYLLTQDHDPDRDHAATPGWLTECDLTSRKCHDVEKVAHAKSIVFPYGLLT